MDFYRTFAAHIELRSFSNVWFWISLAAIWGRASLVTLGVPADMIRRAAGSRGDGMDDLEDLVRIRVRRKLSLSAAGGAWLVAGAAAILATLALVGFRYGLELAQAVFLIALPLAVVEILAVRTAAEIEARSLSGRELCRRLWRHRIAVQSIAMASIFVSALWGMYRNLSVGPIGI